MIFITKTRKVETTKNTMNRKSKIDRISYGRSKALLPGKAFLEVYCESLQNFRVFEVSCFRD